MEEIDPAWPAPTRERLWPRGPCPGCGSDDVVPTLFGEPEHVDWEMSEKGELHIGACFPIEGAPRWVCRGCGLGWPPLRDMSSWERI